MEKYIRSTLSSVFNQDYDNLEYILVDGGSTDKTVEYAYEYENKITKIISEPDEGQYNAINKGMNMATGDIMCWLNADDIYMPWTFSIISQIFRENPDVDWIMGMPSFLNEHGHCTRVSNNPVGYPVEWIKNGWYKSHLGGYLQQESMFWRKSLWDKVRGLDETYKLGADFELWTRFSKYSELVAVSVPLAAFRILPGEQRSSALRETYEADVERACSLLKKPNTLWNYIAQKGVVARSLCRLICYKTSPVISYSQVHGKWVKTKLRNSISRSSLAGLILDYKITKS